MRPINLYDDKNNYVATVTVPDDIDLSSAVQWKANFYRFETPDRARQTPLFVADAQEIFKAAVKAAIADVENVGSSNLIDPPGVT